eukprot:265268-Rhodomonas_salina.3
MEHGTLGMIEPAARSHKCSRSPVLRVCPPPAACWNLTCWNLTSLFIHTHWNYTATSHPQPRALESLAWTCTSAPGPATPPWAAAQPWPSRCRC